jgi:hypothetical protein
VAVARKILLTNAAVVGFLLAGPGVDGWPVLLRLGRALRAVAASSLGLVRAQVIGQPGEGRQFAPLDGSFEERPLPDEHQLTELVVPPAPTVHDAAPNLGRVVARATSVYAHLLVDLSGFLPEAREVLEVPDAFVSAAVAGRTRERELRALVDLLPTSRHLGTLLLDR